MCERKIAYETGVGTWKWQEGVTVNSALRVDDICPFCLSELARGVPEDGKCGHEEILATYPHLRFNARDKFDAATLEDSETRFVAAYRGNE